jgi:hypothetical protein
MSQTVEVLIIDLLEWLARSERSYQETMDAWRTSCPKLPVWEDATDRGLVCVENGNARSVVRVTPAGRALLEKTRPHTMRMQNTKAQSGINECDAPLKS